MCHPLYAIFGSWTYCDTHFALLYCEKRKNALVANKACLSMAIPEGERTALSNQKKPVVWSHALPGEDSFQTCKRTWLTPSFRLPFISLLQSNPINNGDKHARLHPSLPQSSIILYELRVLPLPLSWFLQWQGANFNVLLRICLKLWLTLWRFLQRIFWMTHKAVGSASISRSTIRTTCGCLIQAARPCLLQKFWLAEHSKNHWCLWQLSCLPGRRLRRFFHHGSYTYTIRSPSENLSTFNTVWTVWAFK